MTKATLFAAKADAALKPFGLRVTTWGNSRTKFCVRYSESGFGEVMLKIKVEELIKLRQQWG